MERTAPPDPSPRATPRVPAPPQTHGRPHGPLDGMPRQWTPEREPGPGSGPVGPDAPEAGPAPRGPSPWYLLPTPTATPFTFWYAVVLAVTSCVAAYADPALVHALHQGSSTDVAHLLRAPVPVLAASALWVAGGFVSPFAVGFVVVLTALERRLGALRTAAVFVAGHALATLATEGPVGLAVLAGHLPGTSLHRLDYGISFGVAASVGALSGLLAPWLRWPLLIAFGGLLLQDLVAFTDPLTNWGHLIALAVGVALWPTVRGWRRDREAAAERRAGPGPGRADRPTVRATAA
ncbi:rhomboid-like protein [Streptomyces longwoodensis]|uniref:rhomboid-like protein n=1 Tax=Streptomyces longwoodensis TaxID=68231 RepID=UPI0033AA4276